MQPIRFCQSCTMPIDKAEDRGTEKDGSGSEIYCKYCYKDGALINPGMTLDEMKNVVTTQMQKMNLPEHLIQQSLAMLPGLKRWKERKTQLM